MFRRVVRGFCVSGRSFGVHACMFLFPTTTSALDCFKPGGLFINTEFVYKHCVSVYRAFSVLSLLDLLVVFYVYYMIVNSCRSHSFLYVVMSQGVGGRSLG